MGTFHLILDQQLSLLLTFEVDSLSSSRISKKLQTYHRYLYQPIYHCLSQEQLAEKAKVSVRTIQRLESGQDVSIETLNLVAGALSVEVKDLFTDQKTKKEEREQHAS